jgi:hypothetical protein
MAALSTPTALSPFSPPMLKRFKYFYFLFFKGHHAENVTMSGNQWFPCIQLEQINTGIDFVISRYTFSRLSLD